MPLIITGVYSQPHNLDLGRLSPTAPGTAAAWTDYYGGWMLANHLRVVTGIASGVALVTGVVRR